MALYPLDLVLATAVASASLFLGSLPTRLIRAGAFARPILGTGLAWLAVALLSPVGVAHYDVMLAGLCLLAWWNLRQDRGLAGKMWLFAAAGLGISLGVVILLAVTPEAYPGEASVGTQALRLGSIYSGGVVIGLAGALFVFTRRGATQAGIPAGSVGRQARFLVGLTLLRAALWIVTLLAVPALNSDGGRFLRPVLEAAVLAGFVVVIPALATRARRRIESPAPSRSGPALLALGGLAFGAECLARWLGL